METKTKPKNWNGCRNCMFLLKRKGGKCKAYPDGIPFEFISGNIPHLVIEKDQIGTFIWKERIDTPHE